MVEDKSFWVEIDQYLDDALVMEDLKFDVSYCGLNGSDFPDRPKTMITTMTVYDNGDNIPLVYHPGRRANSNYLLKAGFAMSAAVSIMYEYIKNPSLVKQSRLLFFLPISAPLYIAYNTASLIFNLKGTSDLYSKQSEIKEGYYDLREENFSKRMLDGAFILKNIEDFQEFPS